MADLVQNIEIGENFANSDHQIIRFNIAMSIFNETNKKYFNYSKGDFFKAVRLAANINWNVIVLSNVEEGWQKLNEILLNIREKCVPLIQSKRSKCKWSTRKVIKCRRAKIKAWEKYCGTQTVEAYDRYKLKRNLAQQVNRTAQKEYEIKLAIILILKVSSHIYVNNKKKLGTKIGPIKDQNGTIISDDKVMVNIMNT